MDAVNSGGENTWFTTIRIGGKETTFKLDTGAEVTAVTQETVSDEALYGPSRHPLGVLEKFKGDLTYGGKITQQEVFVVEGLKNNLMGLPAITALKLAARLDYTATMDHTQSLAISFKMKYFPRSLRDWATLEKLTILSSNQMQSHMPYAHLAT